MKARAPITPPHSQPVPPMTKASITSALRWKSNTSSEAKARRLRQQRTGRASEAGGHGVDRRQPPCTDMPSAATRSRLSRMACSETPSGECTMRRSSTKAMKSTLSE